MAQKLTDLQLIEEVLNGNTSSFALLIKQHQRYVFSLALRFVKNREVAEEIAQDSFVKAYKSLGSYKFEAKFSTWLYRIVYTTSMTYLRKNNLSTQSIYEEEVYSLIKNDNSPYRSDAYDNQSTYQILNNIINQLPIEDAQIITLFYKGEQSLEEIAQIIGTNSNYIKVKLHRARLKIKSKMQLLLKNEINELL
jgi:RNA polymerase sigma factor (sigma-70 family)